MRAVLLLALFFIGCETYQQVLQPDKARERYVQATRKGEIRTQLRTEAVILATYLNQALPKYFDSKKGVYFLVDIYISNDSIDSSKRGLLNPLYSIWLFDDIKPISIKRLSKDELIAYNFDYVSPWGEHFLVEFPAQSKTVLTLFVKKDGLEATALRYAPPSSLILDKI